jgi:ribonuclease HII
VRALRGTAGVDDAGRGPIIGPLLVAGVLSYANLDRKLLGMGVRDSKILTPEVRSNLAGKIKELADSVSVAEAEPKEIDDVVLHGGKLKKLNFLEAKLMAQVVNSLRPEEVYVDASDVNEERYGETIREFLLPELKNVRIISKHHADSTYPLVSAASIIAKVHRDDAVAALRHKWGDFGSGYITDPKTMHYLREWRKTHLEYPPIVRLSWKTIKEIEREFSQSRLRP